MATELLSMSMRGRIEPIITEKSFFLSSWREGRRLPQSSVPLDKVWTRKLREEDVLRDQFPWSSAMEDWLSARRHSACESQQFKQKVYSYFLDTVQRVLSFYIHG